MNGNGSPVTGTEKQQTCPDEDALGALRFGWGEAYRIGRDAERGWWAQRRDDIGGDITADDADELWHAIRQDHDGKPVPRDCPAPLAEA